MSPRVEPRGFVPAPRWGACLVVLFLAACSSPSSTPSVPAGTPVVLISIDTLRADHLPAFGYKGVETPHLDELRRDSILFTHAYTPTPLTLPAHSSLLTGLLPGEHGVRDNVGYALDAAKIRSGELPFLPAILQKKGYATGGAVSAYVLLGKSGLETGFDLYEDSIELQTNRGLGGLQRPGGETLRLAGDWLRGAVRPLTRRAGEAGAEAVRRTVEACEGWEVKQRIKLKFLRNDGARIAEAMRALVKASAIRRRARSGRRSGPGSRPRCP